MFERFSEQATRIVAIAQEEARAYNHETYGPEHLLLALMKSGLGVGGKALTEDGIDLEDAGLALGLVTQRIPGDTPPEIPPGNDALAVLDTALERAILWGDPNVDTQHILLNLLECDSEPVKEMFNVLDTDVSNVRARCVYAALEQTTPANQVREKVGGGARGPVRVNAYSEQSKMALKIAQDRAKLAGRKYAGTEQLLLGIVCGDSFVAQELLWLKGVNITVLSEKIKEVIGRYPVEVVENVEYTPTAMRVLNIAQMEASRRQQSTGIAHIMYGLLMEERSIATEILNKLGLDRDSLRRELAGILESDD